MYLSCNFQYIGKKGAYDSPGGASSQTSMETKRWHAQTNSLELNLSTGLLTESLQISTVRNQQIGHGRMNGLYQWSLPANCLDEMLSWQHETSAVCTSLAVSHLYILLVFHFVNDPSRKQKATSGTKSSTISWCFCANVCHIPPRAVSFKRFPRGFRCVWFWDSENIASCGGWRWRFQTFARGTWHLGLRCGFRGHLVVPGELGGWVPAKQVPRTPRFQLGSGTRRLETGSETGALGTGFGKVLGRGFREPGFGKQVLEPGSGLGCWEPGDWCFRPGPPELNLC